MGGPQPGSRLIRHLGHLRQRSSEGFKTASSLWRFRIKGNRTLREDPQTAAQLPKATSVGAQGLYAPSKLNRAKHENGIEIQLHCPSTDRERLLILDVAQDNGLNVETGIEWWRGGVSATSEKSHTQASRHNSSRHGEQEQS